MTISLALILFLSLPLFATKSAPGVRHISGTSCDVLPVNLSPGMTTQIVFEQEPKMTLFADKKHFKIVTNASSPRTLAIIPVIEGSEIESLTPARTLPGHSEALAALLNRSFKTNLFVFFDNSNQLMFDLHFTVKSKADYILKVTQTFGGKCDL